MDVVRAETPATPNATGSGKGSVDTVIRLVSTSALTIHVGLGQSAALSLFDSSEITSRLRLKSGITVCVMPLKGGE
jgi:hypothetical protein